MARAETLSDISIFVTVVDAGSFTSAADKLESFRAQGEHFLTPKVRELGTGELELARALESIDLCVALKKSHSRDIAAALARPAAAAN